MHSEDQKSYFGQSLCLLHEWDRIITSHSCNNDRSYKVKLCRLAKSGRHSGQ